MLSHLLLKIKFTQDGRYSRHSHIEIYRGRSSVVSTSVCGLHCLY